MAIANSNGVAAYDEGTQIGASMMSIIKENDVVVNGDESETSRSIDFSFEDIGHKATENAASQLGQKGIETGGYDAHIAAERSLRYHQQHGAFGAVWLDSEERRVHVRR